MDETNRLKNVLVMPFDQAFAPLLDDLQQRGRLDDTVVVMAESSRTRKLDKRAGHGHWGYVFIGDVGWGRRSRGNQFWGF